MGTLVAVSGCIIDHSSGSIVSGGVFTITNVPSTKVKADGKGMFKTPLAFSFTGGTVTGGVSGTAVGAGTIISTAQKVKAESLLVMLEGDTGTLTGTYTQSGSPPVPGVPFSASVEIIDANQTVVNAV